MKKLLILTAVALFVAMMGIAQADPYLPGPGTDGHDFLHVGDPYDGSFIFGGTELVSISANHLQIEDNSGGTATKAPLWLILGVPNDPGTGTAPNANGVAAIADGTFTSGFLYSSKFSITNGGNSQSFGNWSDAEFALTGIKATEFGIYVYDFSTIALPTKGVYDVNFDSSLANGTFAVALANLGGSKFATTPFTQTGFFHEHQVPEPSMLLLFGSGILGLGFFGRKRFRK